MLRRPSTLLQVLDSQPAVALGPVGVVEALAGVGVFALVIGFWLLARRHTRRAAGFDLVWPGGAGKVGRTSDWGTARVDGHLLRGCVRLFACEHGYVVALRWVWGGGYVFLPAGATAVVEYPARGWRCRPSRGLSASGRHVTLHGRLAQFVA